MAELRKDVHCFLKCSGGGPVVASEPVRAADQVQRVAGLPAISEVIEALLALFEQRQARDRIAEDRGRPEAHLHPGEAPRVVDRARAFVQRAVIGLATCMVTAPPGQVRAHAQRPDALARRLGVDGERALHPRAALLEVPVGEPQPPERSDETQRRACVAPIDVPPERRAQVVVLGLEPLQTTLFVGAEQPRRRFDGQRPEDVGVLGPRRAQAAAAR